MPRDPTPPRRAKRTNVASGFLVRVFALASVAVIASVWALVHFYTHPWQPMVVPAPPDAGGATRGGPGEKEWGDAGVIPAPDLEVVPR